MQGAAEYYDTYYSHPAPPAPEARYEEWLARAEAEVGRGRLLEVGAGSGGLVRVALRRGWSVDATEVSQSALEPLRGTGAAVFAGPVEGAGYSDGRFDLVVSLEVLEHLPTPLAELKQLASARGRSTSRLGSVATAASRQPGSIPTPPLG